MALSARQACSRRAAAGAPAGAARSRGRSLQPAARASYSTAAAAAAGQRQRPHHQQQQQQQQQQQSTHSEQPAKLLQRHERLRDPASFSSRGATTVMVDDAGGPVSLATYMQLPVEQYYCLDPDRITMDQATTSSTSSSTSTSTSTSGGSSTTFTLHVPRVALLGASLEPVIRVQVRTEANSVVLNAIDCKLNASGPVMGGLDEKFAMRFQTQLTWDSPAAQQPARHLVPAPAALQQQQHAREMQQLAAEQQQLTAAAAASLAAAQQPHSDGAGGGAGGAGRSIHAGWQQLTGGSWAGGGAGNSSSSTATPPPPAAAASSARQQLVPPPPSLQLRGSITASSVVEVWCEVIPPFNLMPRAVLESTCSTVVSGLVASLLPWFARELAKDYAKWAADAAYRAARAARSQPPAATGGGSSTS